MTPWPEDSSCAAGGEVDRTGQSPHDTVATAPELSVFPSVGPSHADSSLEEQSRAPDFPPAPPSRSIPSPEVPLSRPSLSSPVSVLP